MSRQEEDITFHLRTQFDNIYPLIVVFTAVGDLEIFRFLFGYGYPAATFIKLPGDGYSLTPLTGELPRILINHGVVGLVLWLVFVLVPIGVLKRVVVRDLKFGLVLLLYLGVVATSLIHRSHLVYIAACFVLALIPFVLKKKHR